MQRVARHRARHLRHTAERRLERQLIVDYEADIALILEYLDRASLATAVQLAGLPERIRLRAPRPARWRQLPASGRDCAKHSSSAQPRPWSSGAPLSRCRRGHVECGAQTIERRMSPPLRQLAPFSLPPWSRPCRLPGRTTASGASPAWPGVALAIGAAALYLLR